MIDYKTKSLQYIFNRVARHLLKQGKRSEGCVMMDDDGCRCAMGSLIPKKDFSYRYNRFRQNVTLSDYTTEEQFSLITDLQNLHDHQLKVRPSRWPAALRAIAVKWELKIPHFLQTGV